MAKDRTTIQDIADALGLSRTTVSKALNGAPHMPEKTVNNVLQMAKKLNYKQFSYLNKEEANKEVFSKGGTFALFANYIPEQFHIATSIMASLEQEMRKYGYSLTVYMLNPDDIHSLRLPPNFRLDETDAVLCIELFNQKYSEMVCSLGKPVVFFDSYYAPETDPLNANIILMESRHSTFRMINSIVSKYSLKNVGFIGDIYHCVSFHERYEGFLDALKSNNIDYDPSYCVIDNDLRFHETNFLAESLEKMPRLPDLFFCANDLLAGKIITVLTRMGIHISRDLLICGFDDTLSLNPINSTLTTVRTPSWDMGILATKLLINQLADPNIPPTTAYLNGHIQMRSSTVYK